MRKVFTLKNSFLQGDKFLLLTTNCNYVIKEHHIDRLPQKYMLYTRTAAFTRNLHNHAILSSSDVMAV